MFLTIITFYGRMKFIELSPWAGAQPNFLVRLSAYSHFLKILLWFQKAPATQKPDLQSFCHVIYTLIATAVLNFTSILEVKVEPIFFL